MLFRFPLLYDLRRKMVEEYNRLSSYRAVAKKFNVNVKTVIKWVKRFEKYGFAGLTAGILLSIKYEY